MTTRDVGRAGLLAILLATAPAAAEDARLTAYLGRPESKQAVVDAIRRQMHDLRELCQSMRLRAVGRLTVQNFAGQLSRRPDRDAVPLSC